MSQEELFDWMGSDAESLNGSSDFRSAKVAKFTLAGDGMIGTCVRVERSHFGRRWEDGSGPAVTVLRVEAGRLDGEPVESGSWRSVYWASADLHRAWTQVGGVNVGDRLVVGYAGKEPFNCGASFKHCFSISVQRANATAEEDEWT